MDTTFLLEALKLGIGNMTTQAVKDSYEKLKALLKNRFAHNPTATEILKKYEH